MCCTYLFKVERRVLPLAGASLPSCSCLMMGIPVFYDSPRSQDSGAPPSPPASAAPRTIASVAHGIACPSCWDPASPCPLVPSVLEQGQVLHSFPVIKDLGSS